MLFPFLISQFYKQALGVKCPCAEQGTAGSECLLSWAAVKLLLSSFELSSSGGGRGTGEHAEESWRAGRGWSVGRRGCRSWAAPGKGRLGGWRCSHRFSLQAAGRGRSWLLPAVEQQGAAAPDWGLGESSWALGEWLGHPSSPPGTAATRPHLGLCPGDPHPRSSPTIPGRSSRRWLAQLHNPAAARCLHTTIGTIFIPFVVVTSSKKSPWGGGSPPPWCYVGHFSHLSSCPACACPCQPSILGPAGTRRGVSVLRGVKPWAWAQLRACPACSACRHQPEEACISGETVLLPLPHPCNSIAPRSGRKQESTKMLCPPGPGPRWSRPAGELPTLTSTVGLPGAGAAPSALLQGGGMGPLRGPALLPLGVKPLAPQHPYTA